MAAISLKDNASVEARVTQLIVDKFGIAEKKVRPEAGFIKDFGADSLDIYEFMLNLEKEFDIIISDEEVAKIKTVGEVVVFIKTHMA